MIRREFLARSVAGPLLPFLPGSEVFHDASHRPPDTQERPDIPSQRMHPDFMTYLPGIEYFYFGNGDILGAMQYCADDPRGTFLGFTFMIPDQFCRKWSTFLYHPERGLANTRLGVSIDEQGRGPDPASGMYSGVRGYLVDSHNFRSIAWTYPDRVPVLSLNDTGTALRLPCRRSG